MSDALQAGAPTASITVNARSRRATTRTLLATLPGQSREKIVIESHTDGMNAVWDNGPVAMVAMARYLARLPLDCRPRTLQFAFVTGHLYQRLRARRARRGRRAARPAPRSRVRPGQRGRRRRARAPRREGVRVRATAGSSRPGAQASGRSELVLSLITESPSSSAPCDRWCAATTCAERRCCAGAEPADDSRVPPHCSFGGEGTPYNHHLLPTVAAIAAPQILFNPPFGLDSIDFGLMRRQTLAFTELTRRLDRMRLADIAGRVLAVRRSAAPASRRARSRPEQPRGAIGAVALAVPRCCLPSRRPPIRKLLDRTRSTRLNELTLSTPAARRTDARAGAAAGRLRTGAALPRALPAARRRRHVPLVDRRRATPKRIDRRLDR